jgi:hypothetical protein
MLDCNGYEANQELASDVEEELMTFEVDEDVEEEREDQPVDPAS